jgi:hypothetical protein
LKYELEVFRLGGAFQLREDTRFVGTLEPAQVSVDVAYGKLILSCWDEGWSKSWRVVSGEIVSSGLTLACTRKMGMDRCRLELQRGTDIAPYLPPSDFASGLRSLIESNLAGLRVVRVERGRDDRRGLSSSYVRLKIKERSTQGGSIAAGILVSGDKDQSVVDGALAAGLVWADALSKAGTAVGRLLVFAPSGRATSMANRLTLIRQTEIAVQLYEIDEQGQTVSAVSPFDQGDLSDNLKKVAERVTWPEDVPPNTEVERLVSSVVGIAPEFIDARARDGGICISIRGLEFGRVAAGDGRLYFGPSGERKRLGSGNWGELQRLIWRIISERTPHSEDRNGDIYRAQSERWLESIIKNRADVIDPNIDSRHVYCQVPACRGEERTYIDLLAATRSGRLVVIELKTAEDSDFPFQGLDYWMRVNWHAQRGDFQRRGYFRGLALSDEPPLLYLVAPLFRFHSTTALIAGAVSEQVPLYRIGINEDWRAGVRVLLRERLN